MPGQTVQITINVTDGNASEAVQQVVAQLNAIGPAGEAAGAQAGAGFDRMREGVMGAREEARLMNEDLHIGLSRAMLGVVADTNILSGAISALGPAFIGLGAVEIFEHMGEAAYNFYEKMFDVDAITAEYQKKLDDLALKQFLNPENAQMALTNLQQINAQIDELNDKKSQSAATWGGFLGAGERYTPDDEKKRTTLLDQQRQLDDNATKYSNQSLDNGIAQMEKFVNATEKGYQQIKDLKDLADQKTLRAFSEGKFGDPRENFAAAYDKYQDALGDNQTDATGKKMALQKQQSDETSGLQNAATASGLSGVELLESKRLQAIAEFESKYGASMKAIEAIDQDYLNQKTALLDRDEEEGEKARQTRLQQEDEAAKQGFEQQAAYEERKRALLDSTNAFEAQGYAKIDAENAKRLDEFAKMEAAQFTNSVQAFEAYSQDVAQIDADSARERQQLHQKTMEEITKEEQQAARMSLPEWKQAQQAIIDAENDRVKQIDEAEAQQLKYFAGNVTMMNLIQQEANAQKVAAYLSANAQLQRSDEETRDKLASGLQSLFEHPEKFFESTAMKTGFQLMANEMLQVFQSSGPAGGILQYLFGMGPQMDTSKNPLIAMGSALGIGGEHSGAGGGITPMQISQGGTNILTGSNTFLQGVDAFQSAVGTMGAGGTGLGNGGFGMLGSTNGSTFGGAGVSSSPYLSGAAGLGANSPMPQTEGMLTTGGLDANGNFTGSLTPDVQGGAATPGTLGTIGGIAGGALMGATSIYSAYQNSNPVAGAAGGAMGGMETGGAIGSLVGGPAGAVIGGAIGAIAGGIAGLFAGIFGDQGKGQAEGLDVNTIQPQLAKDMQDYETGRSGYSAVASDLTNMLTSANHSTSAWGSGARNYYSSNIAPEINAALASLQKQEIGGRSAITLSAGQYHWGGTVDGFGDLATSDTEGFIHARQNEFVVNPMAAQSHAPLLNAINTGNVSYSNSVQPRMPASSGSGAPVFNLSCWDSKSVARWMKAGGARAITSGLNQGQTQYSGVGR